MQCESVDEFYRCTLEHGHKGQHDAAGYRQWKKTWSEIHPNYSKV